MAGVSGNREIVALHPPEPAAPYAIEVHHRIRRDERSEYARTARDLSACVDVVSIQYDEGTWGGADGEYVLDFIRALDLPTVATLHTVRRRPTDAQHAILSEIVARAEATVVMSRSAATLLTTIYGADASRVDVIPHGVPDLPQVDPATIKPAVGVEGHDVILSFGLVAPRKGFELVIEAMPAVVAAHPKAIYVIVGPTHPDLIRRDDESYREGLVARVKTLGLQDHIRFVDRFVGRVERLRWLEAADVVVTPYPDLEQSVSGTLASAMSAGRPVVSTPFAYASELLAEGRGVLVAAGSATEMADALGGLLADAALRGTIGQRAHAYTRGMVWSRVGADYGRLFERVAAGARASVASTPMTAIRA